MEDKHEDIELRGEELQEMLSAMPAWILRRGITLVAIIVIILLGGSAVFKYPDVITAQVTITGTTPTAGIIAKRSGKLLKIYVKDNQNVREGEPLAIIDNPADFHDILYLKQYIEALVITDDKIPPLLTKENINLGDIQSSYTAFSTTISEYIQFRTINYHTEKINVTKEKIHEYQSYYTNMTRQVELIEKQTGIAKKQYVRDSTLHHKKLISDEDMENAYSIFLNAKLSLESMLATLKNIQFQIKEMNESLLDVEYQYIDKKQVLENQLRTLASKLLNEIQAWEMNYLLVAPLNGYITFTNFWVENQNVVLGEEVFNIVPNNQGALIGKALLPIQRSGKVEIGQIVNIRFNNFPDTEFGIVKGYVENISLVPSKRENSNQYILEISFPNKLTTTYNKILPFLPEMEGTADIITDDFSLLERFFLPLKNIFRNY